MPRGGNHGGHKVSPITNQMTFKDDDEKYEVISKSLNHNLKYWGRDKVSSDEDFIQRFKEYIEECMNDGCRPSVEGMALAMGTIRQELWDWEIGRYRGPVSSDLVKKAKQYLASFDADMVSQGKMNPVAYIFRSKNFYGMKDQQEVVVTPHQETVDIQTLLEEAEILPDDAIVTEEDSSK